MFNPGLEIGQILKNSEIVETFKCGNMGGMRRSKTTNTLVIVSDYTKGLYHDKWIGGVLHYTGMGKSGDQDIHWAQNATLAACGRNGVDVHLFEVMDDGEYVASDHIFIKAKTNALTSEAFCAFIEENSITEFVITGADATACVKSTCYNMTKAGYAVTVLSDCVTSYDKKKIPVMLEYYKSKNCIVVTLDQMVATSLQ